MSWEDRLAPSIKFISPKGRQFSALWRGDNITKTKKLGSFSPPNRKGTIFQDLDVDSTQYPLTFFFNGQDHDVAARLFFETCSEKGKWKIEHPTKGILEVQLVTVILKDQPIKAGNQTEIESQWVEPLKDDQVKSSAELARQIQAQLDKLNQIAAAQLANVSSQDNPSKLQALRNSASSAMSTITNGLAKISAASAEIARVTNDIQRATTTNLNNPFIAINSLATQLGIASQAPALAVSNVSERASSYTNVLTAFSTNTTSDPTPEFKNTLAIKEISSISLLGALPIIAISGDFSSRKEAVDFAELMAFLLELIAESLDNDQEVYAENILENQYFSQSESYSDLLFLIALAIEFLLNSLLNLNVEKIFTLDRERTPIDITIDEYGGLGENDINLDLFISTNNLKGEDILLLPAGREVVVYV